MKLRWPDRYPDEVLDYEFDWSSRLNDGETISGVEITTSDTALVVDSHDTTDGVTKLWLSGGPTRGRVCKVFLTMTTNAGRVDTDVVEITVLTRAA